MCLSFKFYFICSKVHVYHHALSTPAAVEYGMRRKMHILWLTQTGKREVHLFVMYTPCNVDKTVRRLGHLKKMMMSGSHSSLLLSWEQDQRKRKLTRSHAVGPNSFAISYHHDSLVMLLAWPACPCAKGMPCICPKYALSMALVGQFMPCVCPVKMLISLCLPNILVLL